MTLVREFSLYVGILVGAQLAFYGLFWLKLRAAPSRPGRRPRVGVVVPCKGAIEGLSESVRALLGQTLAPAEVVFVVPSEEDPAAKAIRAAIAGEPRARLLVSAGGAPRNCSGKIVDLLYALDRVGAECEILAFADADLRVRPDWLERLVAPLEDPAVGAATSCALYVAEDSDIWTFMRMVWMAAVVPYAAVLGLVIGQSYALRRADFAAFGVAEVWKRALLEDLPLGHAVRKAGKKVVFVAAAVSVSVERCDRRLYFSLLNKWVALLRVYDLRTWACAALATYMHAWVFFWALKVRRLLPLGAALLAGDSLALGLLFAAYARELPDRFEALSPRFRPVALWAALAAPALWLSYAAQLLNSAVVREIRWGGRLYRVRGPADVEVVG